MCATASGQTTVRDGESRVKAGTAPEGNTCKGNVLVPFEAMADRLQGSVSGSSGAREAKRPQPQGESRSRNAIAKGTGGLLQPKQGDTKQRMGSRSRDQ